MMKLISVFPDHCGIPTFPRFPGEWSPWHARHQRNSIIPYSHSPHCEAQWHRL